MEYTKEQITAAIDATSPMCFVLHVLGTEYCDAVFVAMQLSHDQDGRLTEADKETITSLMPD
jgi:hypothetical protein